MAESPASVSTAAVSAWGALVAAIFMVAILAIGTRFITYAGSWRAAGPHRGRAT